MAWPLASPDPDPIRGSLRADLDEKRDSAKRAWAAFDAARQRIKASNPDEAELKHAQHLHDEYEKAQQAARRAEEALLDHLDKVEGVRAPLGYGQYQHRGGGIGEQFVASIGGAKALIDGTGGAAIPSTWDPRIRAMLTRRAFVRDFLTVRRISTGFVEYRQQTVQTNNAAPVAHGDLKPTSIYTIVKKTESVKTIAHLSEPQYRQDLADDNTLALFIESEMIRGLILEEENQLINGDGTGEDFTGLLNVSGIGSVPKGTDSAADAIYKAVTVVRMANFEPTLIVVNPLDFQDLRLARELVTGGGGYLAASVVSADNTTIWGFPYVATTAIAEGTALVGDFAGGATLWDRESPTVRFSEAAADNWEKNLITFRAEERLAWTVEYPAAFAEVTGL